MKLSYLKPSTENIAFIKRLSRLNFDTKFAIGSHLQYLVDVDLDLCFTTLSRKWINGKDWRIWQSLNIFIFYLSKYHDDKRTIDFIEDLVTRFGIHVHRREEKHNELLENAIDIIIDNTFKKKFL